MRARWCCAEVVFLEAEVRGSVSYTVNGFQSVRPSNGWRRRRRFHFAVLQCSSSALRVFVVQFRMEIVSHRYSLYPVLFRWVAGCDNCVCDVTCVQFHNHCGVASPLTSTPCCCSCARSSALSFFSSSICCLSSSLSISTRSTSL